MKSVWVTLKELFAVLPKGAKPFYVWYSIVTGLLSLLDTVALALIAIVITPMVNGDPITLPLLGELDPSATPLVVVAICALFVIKGIFAVLLHWFATRRFAHYELEVGGQLFEAYVNSSWEERSRYSTSDVTRIVDGSMALANMQFILPLSQIPNNVVTFVGVLIVLIVAQPLTALLTLIYLTIISLITLVFVTRRAGRAGLANRDFGYRAATIISEMVDALKELTLRDKLPEAGEAVSVSRKVATDARANLSYYAIIPKYIFDAALIGGLLLIGGVSFALGGEAAAVVSISLFAATGFRMIPAMNGIQSSITQAVAAEPYARDVINELTRADFIAHKAKPADDIATLPDHPQQLTLKDITYSYPGSESPVLRGIDLTIPFGSRVAIVGPSGAGKSTLVDVILGLSIPNTGELKIDNLPVTHVLKQWRAHIGYVPQKVAVFDGSVAQNVALTWGDSYDEKRVIEALELAQLSNLASRGEGLQEKMGERGAAISGGQQQRLGIARALYAEPLVMVLDEATSSLDTDTENKVTAAMNKLAGRVTFITIAHRLATIRDYDIVCYLADGKVQSQGTFDEVVAEVPDFRRQAELAGLI